jgi:hypothetical protein
MKKAKINFNYSRVFTKGDMPTQRATVDQLAPASPLSQSEGTEEGMEVNDRLITGIVHSISFTIMFFVTHIKHKLEDNVM